VTPTLPCSLCLSGLQAIPIFGYSFYSFPYSLHFLSNWYHWYQCRIDGANRSSDCVCF
jgi:hypothetical protein